MTNKNEEPGDLTGELYQTFKEELTSTFFKPFQITIKYVMLLNLFYTIIMTLFLKLEKYATQKRKLQANITVEQRCKKAQQNISKLNSKH